MMPTYSMMGPFRGHMSLKSSPFSPGPSCKLSKQYIIQDHMAAHYKKLMSVKAAVDSSAPKSLHTSVKYKDQQKRDRLIQALEKYKKDLVPGLPASAFNSRSVSPSQPKARWLLLENGHLYLATGPNNCSGIKREQSPSVSFQRSRTSRTLMPAPTARKTIQSTAQHALSQNPVHSSSTDRSPASPRLQSHMSLGTHNRKKAFQNSCHKTYSGDLLDRHSIYFTEKKQCFTPQILKTSHQSFLVKHRCYNAPTKKKISSPGRSAVISADVNNEKRRELHRFLEDTYVRPHSDHFSQQPVENHELQTADSEMPVSPGLQLKEKEEEYLRFLQDLTNDILIRSRYQEEALEDVFQMHIKSKRHNLDEEDHKAFVLKKMQCKDTKRFTSALRKPKGSGQALSVHSATTCHSESSLAFFKDKVAKAEGDGITSKVRQLKSQTAVTRIRQLKPVLGHNRSVLTEVERRRIVQSLKKELNITKQPDPSISCNGAWQKAASIPPTCF